MIIFLHGINSFRISQKLNKYKEKFTRDIDSTGVNIEILDSNNITTESFRKAVLSGGLFVKKRLVIIKNLFSTRKAMNIDEEEEEKIESPIKLTKTKDKSIFAEIENYVEKNQNSEDTILIFIQSEAHKSQQSKLFKLLKSQKYSEEFYPLTGAKLTNWIKKQVENQNGKINNQAIQFLADNIGSDLWRLSNEINKLIAFKQNSEIQLEDVQQFIKTKLDENIFNLTDAFGRKNKALALKLISDQIESGSAWQYLLIMFARQIKIVLQIKSALDSGVSQYQLANSTGLHPFVIQKTRSQTNLFSVPELKKIYSQLLQIDLSLKISQINPELLFDLLVAG